MALIYHHDDGTDDQLVESWLAGGVDAFGELYSRYGKSLLAFIDRMVGDRDLAEDILQDTFIRAFSKASNYRRDAKFSTWIYFIARNLCRDAARAKVRREERTNTKANTDDVARTNQSNPQEIVLRRELQEQIESAIAELPPNQREVFLLRNYHELSYSEIAQVVQCRLGTAKSRMHYAVENLRRELGHLMDDG